MPNGVEQPACLESGLHGAMPGMALDFSLVPGHISLKKEKESPIAA